MEKHNGIVYWDKRDAQEKLTDLVTTEITARNILRFGVKRKLSSGEEAYREVDWKIAYQILTSPFN